MTTGTAGVDVGPAAPCAATELVVGVVKIDHFYAFANTRATEATVFGTGAYDRFECRSIRTAL